MTRRREDVRAAALHAMYIDMCDGCTRAGLVPPTPEQWSDLLADYLAELSRDDHAPPGGDVPQS